MDFRNCFVARREFRKLWFLPLHEVQHLGQAKPSPDPAQDIGVGRTSQFPLPPNRTGGFPAYGSPVGGLTSKRVDAHEHEPHLRRTSLAPRRKHWASDCDPNHGLAPYALLAGAGGCAIAFVSNCPRRKRCDAGYV